MTDSFPRQQARTQRFTLGRAAEHHRRRRTGPGWRSSASAGPEDALTSLWVLDVAVRRRADGGRPRARCSPATPTDLPPEERVRRERARESAAGITGYATDAEHRVAAAALAGQLVVADLVAGTAAMVAGARAR